MAIEEWHWEITRRCNLQCLHCLYGDCVSMSEMDLAQAEQSINRIATLGGRSLKLTGGEPMMRKDLGYLISHADSVGLKVEMITNGTLLTDRFLDEAGECLNHVAVSIDGFCKAHDTLRGKGAFKMAMSALDRLTSRGIHVSISITVSALNFHELPNLLKFLTERGVDNLHINDLNMVGRAKHNRHLIGLEWDKESRQQLFDILGKVFGYTADNATVDTACNVEPSSVCISASGEVFACTEIMLVCPTNKIGMIQDIDLEEKVHAHCNIDPTKLGCRYTSYAWPGVSLIIQSGQSCPLTKEGV